MIKGFNNSYIYVYGKGIIKTSLSISDNGTIETIGSNKNDGVNVPSDYIVVPGFIDEHIHGSSGFDTMDGTEGSLYNLAKSLLIDGVTSFCPTTMTMSMDKIISALRNIDEVKKQKYKDISRIIGVNLEGPFISPKYKGAQQLEYIRECNVEDFKTLLNACMDIRIVTLAYEQNGAKLVKYLKQNKIVASIGHSNCNSDLLLEGIKNGISCATHTYNAMKPIHHREIGTVGEIMLNDNVYSELICDLIHVSPNAIRLLYKCKGKDKIVLITDSMEAKHLADGEYRLGGQDVFVSDKAARLKDGTLAGSILTMNEAIRNIIRVLNIPLTEAIDMATINPAKNLHLDKKYGSISEGKHADFAIVDKNLNVIATIVDGEVVYSKETNLWINN